MTAPHPLSKSAEINLAKRARSGDAIAFDKLVDANLWIAIVLAKSAARKFDCPQIKEDLEAEGRMGLIEATRRFDPDQNVRLSTYATFWIRRRIQETIETFQKQPRSSLDSPMSHDSRREDREPDDIGDNPSLLRDVIASESPPPEQAQEKTEILDSMRKYVTDLPPEMRHLIEAYFGLTRPSERLSIIAFELGTTEQNVSKMLSQALNSLRASMTSLGD